MLQCRLNNVSYVPKSHDDLWDMIWYHVQHREVNAIQIHWVKAHVSNNDGLTHEAQLDAFYNNAVDLEAKKAVCADAFGLWFALGEIRDKKLEHRRLIRTYHNFLLEMHAMLSEPKDLDGRPMNDMPDFQNLALVQGPSIQYAPLSDETLSSCPHGFEFASRFAKWWGSLVWGDGLPISFHELYSLFANGCHGASCPWSKTICFT